MNNHPRILSVILAAGEGKRMRSSIPKVLHEIAGLGLVGHALNTAKEAGTSEIAAVIGPDREDVASEIKRIAPITKIFEQKERKGTAHAVLQVASKITADIDVVLVLFGDTPLVQSSTLRSLSDAVLENGVALAIMGFSAKNPTGYGRLIINNGELLAIVEDKDASVEEKKINICNGGLMALRGEIALNLLNSIKPNNAQGEFYLTDCVSLARDQGLRASFVIVDEEEALGVNDRAQLAHCENIIQQRLRKKHLNNGVTMIAPTSVFFSFDTQLAEDVRIEPNVFFGKNVKVEKGVNIRAFSHLEGVYIASGAEIGPYARLRPGTKIGEKAKVGNFVEIKNTELGIGAKANHLSYIGDATIGEGANIGAGTITCNYDGFKKFRTEIGAKAFIGSNSSLIAPVKIGDNAFIASGSVVTEDVPSGSLGLARARLTIKQDWVQKFWLKSGYNSTEK